MQIDVAPTVPGAAAFVDDAPALVPKGLLRLGVSTHAAQVRADLGRTPEVGAR
jgi:hypothetical protein